MPAGPILAVIPARLGSERLARKPLHRIAGRPLVEWVWRRVRAFDFLDAVVVATDSDEVAAACRAFGAEAVLTSAAHASGTERVAEVAERPEHAGTAIVVNVQGDEPLVSAAELQAAIGAVQGGADVGTVAAPVGTAAAWRDPAVVKVVRAGNGRALYFSRAPIPHLRDGEEPDPAELAGERYLRHVGVYAYTPAALRRWVVLPPDPFERIERLEQLRPLRAGMSIGVGLVERVEGGVDTEADAARMERRILELMKTASLNAT